jgi:ketosteroid isomerase-like protein
MSEVTSPDDATRAAILDVERRRQEGLLAFDIDALAELYDDALVHIHAPGLIHTKAQLLEHVATRHAYLGMQRDEPLIRLVGDDVAVMTGRLVNRLSSPDGSERIVAGPVTQVLRRRVDGAWVFVSFQMTPDGEQIWPALASELAAAHEKENA